MRWLADAVYFVVGLLYVPVALYHALVVGKNRRGWRQRFGGVPRFDPARRRIWIHAVSLGEINATPKLIEALRERLPDVDLVLSTTTDTGFARGVQLYGLDRVFRFPLDFSWVIARVLHRIRPTLIVLVELEVWPNLVHLASRRGIPVAVVNGRLTERSARRLAWFGGAARAMFADLAWVGAQDEAIAARFRALGAKSDRVGVTSSLKWDTTVVADRVEGDEGLARALGIDRSRPLWVCGSTGPGEEEVILEAYRALLNAAQRSARNVQGDSGIEAERNRSPESNGETVAFHQSRERERAVNLLLDAGAAGSDGPVMPAPLLAIVPRKPERFDEVARLIEREGFACIRRSSHPDGATPARSSGKDVILGDTMGELRKFYSLASVVFVGRSLAPMGGSDPMEVAALARPIVVGPHMENFAEPVRMMREAGCIRVVDSSISLAAAVGDLLSDSGLAASPGRRAREVVLRNQGATRRTADQLIELLNNADRSGR
ncbi:MAG: 3-deoxy-D-manno-octulosonic acid transferase [Phycisphaerales bacterium]|nr:3-deoxy-D-manno-octulosonic acid transferase [Phycisphaerales bacterium]